MHYSRNGPIGSQPRYLASTAVLLVEVIKLSASLLVASHDIRKAHPTSNFLEAVIHLRRSIFAPDCWKLVLPAALYTLQNSLVYIAISNLDAFTFQVTYQLKILTTVLFSIALMGMAVSPRQWLSLFLLTCGVALVQTSGQISTDDWKDRIAALIRGRDTPSTPASNALRGLMAVLAASFTSGLTCVYFEKLVKNPQAAVSLWTRNVQLSFFSLFPAFFIGVVWQDSATISQNGFFAGYNPWVWLTICLQAFGGLVVAMCIAYTDNLAKNFAASFSIVVSYVVSTLLFRTPLMLHSTVGASVVLFAMYLYSSRASPEPAKKLGLITDKRSLGNV